MIPRFRPTFTLRHIREAALDWTKASAEPTLADTLARMLGFEHAVVTGSGRAALTLALNFLGNEGEVVIPAYNCLAVAEAVMAAGWTPVFADVGEDGVNMTLETLKAALTPNTRVVMPTHQFGLPCEIQAITDFCRSRQLFVLEDAAPALGAMVGGKPAGSFGDAAVVSFHLTKVLAAVQGGCLLMRSKAMAAATRKHLGPGPASGGWPQLAKAVALRLLTNPLVYGGLARVRARRQGEDLYQVLEMAKANGLDDATVRCPAFCARLAVKQLDGLATNVARRNALGRLYARELKGINGLSFPQWPGDTVAALVQFPLLVPDKPKTYYAMLRRGVDVSWNFRYCCSASLGHHPARSVYSAKHLIGLPTYPSLTDLQAQEIGRALGESLKETNPA